MTHTTMLRRVAGCATLLALPLQAAATPAWTPLSPAPASALAAAPSASAPQAGQSDRVFQLTRSGKSKTVMGVITEAGLGKVKVMMRGDKEESIDTAEVQQIVWGDVPTTFSDAKTYAQRGEFENAVANYQETATGDAREPLKAAARLASIETMIQWGASDPARFADAVAEADKFLADHGESMFMPKVRGLKARAAWLTGDAAAARDGYKALYEAGKGGAEGYPALLVADAALQGAQAALMTEETSTARELFDFAASAYGAVETEDAGVAAKAQAGAEVASLAGAESSLAKGDFGAAASAFESAAKSATTAAGKGAAKLGHARALLGEGKHREAQLEFAWVAGLDHTSADRRAAALVGMAQAAMGASDAGAGEAKGALERVTRDFGATPWAAKAAELLQGL